MNIVFLHGTFIVAYMDSMGQDIQHGNVLEGFPFDVTIYGGLDVSLSFLLGESGFYETKI